MDWINILKCPITGENLRKLSSDEIESINRKVANSHIFQINGKKMFTELEDGLTNVSNSFIFPISQGVILLLPDLALSENPDTLKQFSLSADKQLVKNFYDNKGWHTTSKGDYEDADIFEDLRPFAQEYLTKCHSRVNRFLKPSGKYLMDAASGALQFKEYLQYSENYEYRICVDLSFQGLQECKRKLGDKAICLLCDMTNLPVKDLVIDGFVSLNTIYHIPKEEQVKAITELYRVLMPGGKGVVVYDWYKHSVWMNVSLLPFRGYEFIRNKLKKIFSIALGKGEPAKMLYFYAHDYDYFQKNLSMPFKLFCWRSVSVPFMKIYLKEWLYGKKLLVKIFNMEEKNPEVCGLNGEYPMFVFEKKDKI